MEEELDGFKPVPVGVVDESSSRCSCVSGFKEGQCSAAISSKNSLSADRLLADACSHLGYVECGASGTGPAHDHAAVVHLEELAGEAASKASSLRRLVLTEELQESL